ncbi:MAG TPA: hypothetical protein VM674_09200 [Candidatus Acidoferrum sp.]|nr:hypothetical protein [Candidatus Acidoferrum sp.]
MRRKAIIVGAVGVLAAAALTVNAQQSGQGTTSGTLGSLVAARAQVVSEEREVSIAVRSTSISPVTKSETEPAEKPDVDAKPAAPNVTLSAACQTAIANLKAMHKGDVAEDAKERTAATEPESATALATDKSEDATEAQNWKNALQAARTACVPQPTTACASAISALQAQLQALHTEELGELHAVTERDWLGDLASVRTAFSAVAAACPKSE